MLIHIENTYRGRFTCTYLGLGLQAFTDSINIALRDGPQKPNHLDQRYGLCGMQAKKTSFRHVVDIVPKSDSEESNVEWSVESRRPTDLA